jgi:hypothetical protein
MEADGQWSLVAAGSVYPTFQEETMPEELTSIDPDALVAAIGDAVEEIERDYLSARLTDLIEDEDIYAQRERAAKFSAIVAASKDPWTKPVQQPAPAAQPGAAPGAAPVPGAPVAPGAPAVANPADAEMVLMNADAQYTVTRDTAEIEDADQFDEADAGAGAPGQQPAQAQQPVTPAPVQPVQ